jgi:hypothetical protein
VALGLAGVVVVASTAGAEPPPFDAAAPITAPTAVPTGPTSQPAPTQPGDAARPGRIVIVGDSVADSLSWGLQPMGPTLGIDVRKAAFPGCGVASGFPVDDNGRAFDWSQSCADAIPPALSGVADNLTPDLVVWLSTWELSDRREDGETLEFGTPEHDAALYAAMEDAAERLTARGAKLIVVPPVPRAATDLLPAEDDNDGRYAHYAALIERLAREHPDSVGIVELGAVICPDGPPCPEEIEGLRLRPDGGHFTETTSPWVGARVMPMILDEYDRLT